MMKSKAALLSLLLGALGCTPVAGDTVRADRCPQWLGTGAAQRPPSAAPALPTHDARLR